MLSRLNKEVLGEPDQTSARRKTKDVLMQLDPKFNELFETMGEANDILCDQLETYNATLLDHVKLLSELNACISFIDTRTSQLKELRNFVRRQSKSLDMIFPHFFNNDTLSKSSDKAATVQERVHNESTMSLATE